MEWALNDNRWLEFTAWLQCARERGLDPARIFRPAQENCQHEPAYPGVLTVVFSLRDPDLIAHLPYDVCEIQYPHLISECRLFAHPSHESTF